jgi:hypothetical protein
MTHDDASTPHAGDDTPFRAFRFFNKPGQSSVAGLRKRMDERVAALLPGDGLPERIFRELGRLKALNIKEVFESFELFERIRRRVRAPVVADLCAGHGLTGILFAAFERSVDGVVLLDQRRPSNHDRVMEAVVAVAPWVAEKTRYVEDALTEAPRYIPPGASVVALHACGALTDRVLDVAVGLRGTVAVMPCCHGGAHAGPEALHRALGDELATDIQRTYRMESLGYRVEWGTIPRAVTRMNRFIVASPRR